jgi:hypothetical protein
MVGDRRLNIRIPADRFERLDEKRFREKLTFQEIGVRLFENWLAGETDQPARSGLRRPADPYIERFAILQGVGDESLVAMIKKAIDVSWGILQHSVPREEIERLRSAAYGEAPKPQVRSEPIGEQLPRRRGRPRKTA